MTASWFCGWICGRPISETADHAAGACLMGDDRLAAAIAAVDHANADDPNTVMVGGQAQPKELAHAAMMTEWVQRLDPDATDAQLLAARAHHLRRWVVPRTDYPEGRAGYLKWRADAKRRHADEVATILGENGYDDATIEQTQQIIRKERLKTDPAVQVHEDALCLVFLQTQLADLARQLGPQKGRDVLAKTLTKMSDRGRTEARRLPLPGDAHSLVIAVLQEVGG
jgi:hypothetical protein